MYTEDVETDANFSTFVVYLTAIVGIVKLYLPVSFENCF